MQIVYNIIGIVFLIAWVGIAGIWLASWLGKSLLIIAGGILLLAAVWLPIFWLMDFFKNRGY